MKYMGNMDKPICPVTEVVVCQMTNSCGPSWMETNRQAMFKTDNTDHRWIAILYTTTSTFTQDNLNKPYTLGSLPH